MPKRSKMTAEDRRIIARAVSRGAISGDRVDHYMELAIAGQDISALDLYVGSDGTTAPAAGPAEDEAQLEADAIALYPPQPGKEREWQAARLAASQASAGDELTDEEADALFPPSSPEEAGQAAAGHGQQAAAQDAAQ